MFQWVKFQLVFLWKHNFTQGNCIIRKNFQELRSCYIAVLPFPLLDVSFPKL